MKAQEKEEKDIIKLKFATALYKAVKAKGIKSFRQLAKEAGMEPAHIQKVSVGKLDVTLTTIIAIANALEISFTKLSSYFDNITAKDIEEFQSYLAQQKAIRGTKSK